MKRVGAARQAQEWRLFRHGLFFQSFYSLQRLDLAESFKGSTTIQQGYRSNIPIVPQVPSVIDQALRYGPFGPTQDARIYLGTLRSSRYRIKDLSRTDSGGVTEQCPFKCSKVQRIKRSTTDSEGRRLFARG
jgi:hypothetical protein